MVMSSDQLKKNLNFVLVAVTTVVLLICNYGNEISVKMMEVKKWRL